VVLGNAVAEMCEVACHVMSSKGMGERESELNRLTDRLGGKV